MTILSSRSTVIDLDQGDSGVALAYDLKVLGIAVLFISGQPRQAWLAKAVAIASLSKPYRAAEMVDAVDYLFRHEHGGETRPAPLKLEMFDAASSRGVFAWRPPNITRCAQTSRARPRRTDRSTGSGRKVAERPLI